jgi:hypothetical protein
VVLVPAVLVDGRGRGAVVSQVKTGDVVAWDKVPSGALVRGVWTGQMRQTTTAHFMAEMRTPNHPGASPSLFFHMVQWSAMSDWSLDRVFHWSGSWATGMPVSGGSEFVTIVALGLTGQETAAELQRIAEVYEVREALLSINDLEAVSGRYLEAAGEFNVAFDTLATDLHAAGWRPGMTAEDAARLLAEVQS